jgi:hypothetical protein
MAEIEGALRRLRANDGTELDLRCKGIGAAVAVAVAQALKGNHTLAMLDLGYNGIGVAGAGAVAEALLVNNTLTTLDLGGNGIGAAGVVAVAQALKVNNTLTKLDLGYNGIGDAGAAALARALKGNHTLTELNLDTNSIGPAGAAAVAQALQGNTALTTLYLKCVSALRSPSLRLNHPGVLSLVPAWSAPLLSFFALSLPWGNLAVLCYLYLTHVCATLSGPDDRRCASPPAASAHCSFFYLLRVCLYVDPKLNPPSSLNPASSAFAPNTTRYYLD